LLKDKQKPKKFVAKPANLKVGIERLIDGIVKYVSVGV
jgi:hypothetical protein